MSTWALIDKDSSDDPADDQGAAMLLTVDEASRPADGLVAAEADDVEDVKQAAAVALPLVLLAL